MPATRRMPARDPKPHDPRAVDAKAAEANPGRGANPGPPRATDPPPAGAHDDTTTEAKAAAPKAPPTSGITADAVSSLYYSVVAKINLLPSNASEDLRTRWRLYSVQALMLASQAERDQAAEQLAKLRDEAVARLAKLRTEAPSNAR